MAKYKKKKYDKRHQFTKKICHWYYCNGCGLVALKNEPTRERIDAGCDTIDDDGAKI